MGKFSLTARKTLLIKPGVENHLEGTLPRSMESLATLRLEFFAAILLQPHFADDKMEPAEVF